MVSPFGGAAESGSAAVGDVRGATGEDKLQIGAASAFSA
jgi:hypothetical protein